MPSTSAAAAASSSATTSAAARSVGIVSSRPGYPPSLDDLTKAVKSRAVYKEGKELKFWVLKAERMRNAGKEALANGDKEMAYVHFSRAAILIFEGIPRHPDTNVVLSKQHREHLYSNGESILEEIRKLKVEFMEREERWEREEREQREEAERERERIRERIERNQSRLARALDPTVDDREPTPSTAAAEEHVAVESRPPTPPVKDFSWVKDTKVDLAKEDTRRDPAPMGQTPDHYRNEKLDAIRLEMEAVSRPPSPSSPEGPDSDSPVESHPLFTSRASDPAGEWDDDAEAHPPPTYEEVMGDVIGLVPPARAGNVSEDEGEYNTEVVEPDKSAGSRTPCMDSVSLPVEKVAGKGGEGSKKGDGINGTHVEISEEARRWAANEKRKEKQRERGGQEISEEARRWATNEKQKEIEKDRRLKDKGKAVDRARSRSPAAGPKSKRSPSQHRDAIDADTAPARKRLEMEREREFREVEEGLEDVYERLRKLRKDGVRELPGSIRERIEELRRFLL